MGACRAKISVSGKRDSDPRPQPWQGCALPTELFPPRKLSEEEETRKSYLNKKSAQNRTRTCTPRGTRT